MTRWFARDCRVGADRVVRVQISRDSKVVSQAIDAGPRSLALSPHHTGVNVMGVWPSIAWASGIAAPRI
jgi:hypothetical protein